MQCNAIMPVLFSLLKKKVTYMPAGDLVVFQSHFCVHYVTFMRSFLAR